jgi:hypothetical protein
MNKGDCLMRPAHHASFRRLTLNLYFGLVRFVLGVDSLVPSNQGAGRRAGGVQRYKCSAFARRKGQCREQRSREDQCRHWRCPTEAHGDCAEHDG